MILEKHTHPRNKKEEKHKTHRNLSSTEQLEIKDTSSKSQEKNKQQIVLKMSDVKPIKAK